MALYYNPFITNGPSCLSDKYLLEQDDTYKFDFMSLLLCPQLRVINIPGSIPTCPKRIAKINHYWHIGSCQQLGLEGAFPSHDDENNLTPANPVKCTNKRLTSILLLRLREMERKLKKQRNIAVSYNIECMKKLPIPFDYRLARSYFFHPSGVTDDYPESDEVDLRCHESIENV